ncbi:MarR family winged helix-turn-helix transcriptional regulator [Actinacidiphila yeochonensis]|uniref:MarR family winged helix-turn-helix transcriptional regulator n=1 Tax=Actinacidiphila yeochonensis TaxID=89050 RepID=UPI000566768B|nr:MarR family transcriptional regulator [Actinacidiphila yeochonensis]
MAAALPDLSDDERDAEAMVGALLTASRLLVAVSTRSLAEVAATLTLPQFRMLVALYTRGSLNLSQLADELDVQPSTALRMIDRLVAAGMVARGSEPADRRASVIALTERGRDTVLRATERRRAELTRIVARMPAAQRRGFVRVLRAFTDAGSEPQARPTPGERLGW